MRARPTFLALLLLLAGCASTPVAPAEPPAMPVVGGVPREPIALPIATHQAYRGLIPANGERPVTARWLPDGSGVVVLTETAVELWRARPMDAVDTWRDTEPWAARVWRGPRAARSAYIDAVEVSPDGRHVAVLGRDALEVVDLVRGETIQVAESATDVAFRDARRLVFAVDDLLANYDVLDDQILEVTGLDMTPVCLAVSTDRVVLDNGRSIAVLGPALEVERHHAVPAHHRDDTECHLRVSDDGRRLARLSEWRIFLLDLATGDVLADNVERDVWLTYRDPLVWGHDGTRLFANGSVLDGHTLAARDVPDQRVEAVPSPIDDRVMVVGDRGVHLSQVSALEARSGETVVYRLLWSTARDALLTLGDQITVWDWRTGQPLRSRRMTWWYGASLADDRLLSNASILDDAVTDLSSDLRPIPARLADAHYLALIPGGDVFVADRGFASVHDLATGQLRRSWTSSEMPVRSNRTVQVAPDGRWAAVVRDEYQSDAVLTEIFDLETGGRVELPGVSAAALTASNRLALLRDHTLEVVMLPTFVRLARCELVPGDKVVTALTLSDDGRYASWIRDDRVEICATDTGETHRLDWPGRWVFDLVAVGEGHVAAVNQYTVEVVELATHEVTTSWPVTSTMQSYATTFVDLEGHEVLVVLVANRVIVWDLEARAVASLQMFHDELSLVTSSASVGRQLVLRDSNQDLYFFDIVTGQLSSPSPRAGCRLRGVSRSGRFQASVCGDGTVVIMDTGTGTARRHELELPIEEVRLIVDEKRDMLFWRERLTSYGEARIGAYDLTDESVVWRRHIKHGYRFELGDDTLWVGWSRYDLTHRQPRLMPEIKFGSKTPEDAVFLSASGTEIDIQDTAGEVLATALAPEMTWGTALTADGSRFATTHDHGIIVWDTATMQPTQGFNIAWDGTVSTWSP